MAGKSKIEKHGLEGRVEALHFREGKGIEEIATILTAELAGQDTIGKSSVGRYLKVRREEVKDQIKDGLNKHAKEHLESDLECIEEIQLFLMNEMRNGITEENPNGHSIKDRAEFAIKAARVIDMKLARSLGTDPAAGGGAYDPVDLDEFKEESGAPEAPETVH